MQLPGLLVGYCSFCPLLSRVWDPLDGYSYCHQMITQQQPKGPQGFWEVTQELRFSSQPVLACAGLSFGCTRGDRQVELIQVQIV